jgi:hypothetical protein
MRVIAFCHNLADETRESDTTIGRKIHHKNRKMDKRHKKLEEEIGRLSGSFLCVFVSFL